MAGSFVVLCSAFRDCKTVDALYDIPPGIFVHLDIEPVTDVERVGEKNDLG